MSATTPIKEVPSVEDTRRTYVRMKKQKLMTPRESSRNRNTTNFHSKEEEKLYCKTEAKNKRLD